jgi:EpsI family protein
MPKFFSSLPVRLASLVLLLQGGLLYSSIRQEFIPKAPPLVGLAKQFGKWQFVQDGVIDAESMEVLKADDTIIRVFGDPSTRRTVELFVASFRSQRTGKAPHSPKNCLPGSGWLPLDDREISINLGDRSIPVNRYVIAHGDDRSLVYYWYQSRDRAVAGEFKAKFWVLADAIRFNRTDTALVRVIVPISNKDEATAEQAAEDFVRSMYGALVARLPS